LAKTGRKNKKTVPTERPPAYSGLSASTVSRRLELLDFVTGDPSKSAMGPTEWSNLANIPISHAQNDLNWLRARLAAISPDDTCKKTSDAISRAAIATMERLAAGEIPPPWPDAVLCRIIDSALSLSRPATAAPGSTDGHDSLIMIRASAKKPTVENG